MEEYMVAAHLIVSKAGPGSIAEAAACALPIMLFDFLPGQEEANVDFVRDQGMGGYEEVCPLPTPIPPTLPPSQLPPRPSSAQPASPSSLITGVKSTTDPRQGCAQGRGMAGGRKNH